MDIFLNSLLLVLNKSFHTLLQLLPFLAAGIVIGEVLKLTSWSKLIYRWVSLSPALSIAAAAVLGALSPLCTFGTVPIILVLLRAGVGIAPLVTFLTVSSMMNPQLFIFTWGGLGPEIAVARLIAVLIFGLVLGLAAHFIPSSWVLKKTMQIAGNKKKGIAEGKPGRNKWNWKVFLKDVLANLQYVSVYLIIGTVLGAAVEVYMPQNLADYIFKTNGWLSVFLAALLGVPLYACGGGVIPLVQSFVNAGMSKAAALAFLIVGPATRIAPLAALGSVVRVRFIAIYVSGLMAYALLISAVYR